MSGSGRRTTCPGLAVAPYGRIVSRLGAVGRRPAPGSWLPGLRRILRPPRPRAVTPKPCSSGLVTAPPWRPAERRSPCGGVQSGIHDGGANLRARERCSSRRDGGDIGGLSPASATCAPSESRLLLVATHWRTYCTDRTELPRRASMVLVQAAEWTAVARCAPSVRAAVRLLGPLGGPQGRTPLVALLGDEEGRRRRGRSGIRRSRCRSGRSDRRGETAYGLACECLGFIQRDHAGVNTEAASALGVVQPRVATGHKQQLLPSGAQGERLGDLVRPQGTDGAPDRQQRQGTDKGREWTP